MTERTFYRVIVTLIIASIITIIGIVAIDELWNIESESYFTEMEITHCESTSYYVRNEGAHTTRTFYLKNENQTIAIDVDEETFASYSEGDLVKLNIRTLECPITHTIKECATIVKNLP